MSKLTSTRPSSVLATLRALIPERQLSFAEATRLTELQAQRFRELLSITTPELPDEAITDLPRIVVREMLLLPASASSQWSEGKWIIAINGLEPWQRQRFSIGHELWHIINYRTTAWLCPPDQFTSGSAKAERLADYFSGCLHVPKRDLRRLAGQGLAAGELADVFGVSVPAISVRLSQLKMQSKDHYGLRTRHGKAA
jgi:Zn-dependent peptidase ImmA (M78 family)